MIRQIVRKVFTDTSFVIFKQPSSSEIRFPGYIKGYLFIYDSVQDY